MVSPYERTTPKLLATKGYVSALFGKFHLALQGNNPRATRCPAIWAGTTSRAGWTRPATRPRSAQLATLLASQPACPGDGNIDFVVNQQDLEDWRFYSESFGLSSVYDLNLDGLTNTADRATSSRTWGWTAGPTEPRPSGGYRAAKIRKYW
jgi:hypothetical protein